MLSTEQTLAFVVGILTWVGTILWNANNFNKSAETKLKGVLDPFKAYWDNFGLYVAGSFVFTAVALILITVDALPVTLLWGSGEGAKEIGDIALSAIAAYNIEQFVNGLRRSNDPAKK